VSTINPALRSRLGRRAPAADVLGPALVACLLPALLVCAGLVAYDGNPTGLIRFGTDFAAAIHPPRGAVVTRGSGYDGQYFWALAQDPLLLRARTLAAFADQTFRLQRVAYPALAWLAAGGGRALIPWTLIAVNVVAIVAATLAVAAWLRRRGRCGWWSLGLALQPAFAYAVLADLSDALAVAALVGGLIAYWERRRWTAAALLTVAVLAREPMLLAVAAIGIDLVLGREGTGSLSRAAGGHRLAGGVRRMPGAVRLGARAGWAGPRARCASPRAVCVGAVRHAVRRVRVAGRALWPVTVVPVIAFAGWLAYVDVRLGGAQSDPGTAFAGPMAGVAAEVRRALRSAPIDAAWDLAYLTLMLAGILAAALLVARRRCAASLAALLFGLTLPWMVFGGALSYTRLSAPMFACLLLAALARRSRPALALCAAVASLGPLVALGIG